MKTPDEIKKALEYRVGDDEDICCDGCAYCGKIRCVRKMTNNALAYIRQLEAQVPKWISVEERLPERMKPVLVLATGRYEEDGYDVLIAYHDEGEWEEQCVHSHECCAFYIYADVKFWMPLPEPPVMKGE